MTAKVRVEFEGDVAVVLIDNPPINSGSAAVRQGLLQVFLSLSSQESVRGIVLLGAGRTFMSGSDLREFGAPLIEPQLPAVIAAIEACPKPVVAGLHGAALGGGGSNSPWAVMPGLHTGTPWLDFPKSRWASFLVPGVPSVYPG